MKVNSEACPQGTLNAEQCFVNPKVARRRSAFDILPVWLSCCLLLGSQPMIMASSDPKLNFKIYSGEGPTLPVQAEEKNSLNTVGDANDASTPSKPTTKGNSESAGNESSEAAAKESSVFLQSSESVKSQGAKPAEVSASQNTSDSKASPLDQVLQAQPPVASNEASPDNSKKPQQIASKVLQGYIRVVPSGTKVPIIMDTAVDSDTSQEGDEFSARTSEDLSIDGAVIVPAGSTIKGRIAQLNAPRHLNRSGSVALKFDTVTTPDNRQIPIVANIVARGGVVHARRGLKDIAIDAGAVSLPVAAGLGIGLLAGNASSSSSIGAGGGAVIGAGIGAAVGLAILLAKKGKKVDVRPGDELKIELGEDLRMPMM